MDLNRHEQFNRLDSTGLIQNIIEFPDQFEAALAEESNIILPTHFVQVNEIVLLGSGSNYFVNLLLQNLTKSTRTPVHVWNKEGIPGFIGSKTLVIALSYSGDNERTLTAFDLAAKRGAKLIGITTGGQLSSLCRKYKSPIIEVQYGAPSRAAFAYIFALAFQVFIKIGIYNMELLEIKKVIKDLYSVQKQLAPEVVTSKNIAKQIAITFRNKIPLIVGGGMLYPVSEHFAYQINHSARMLAFAVSISDYYHQFLYGMLFPVKVNDKLKVIILDTHFQSDLEKEKDDLLISRSKKYGLSPERIEISSSSPLSEALQFIMISDYIAYYAGIYNDVDPELSIINN